MEGEPLRSTNVVEFQERALKVLSAASVRLLIYEIVSNDVCRFVRELVK